VKLAYLVSRFPQTSETFLLREVMAVSRQPGIELELLSLFPSPDEPVHPGSREWTQRLRRPGLAAGLRDSLWWAARRPVRLAGVLAAVVRDYRRRPGVLARALVTVPMAASHARRLRADGTAHLHAHFANYPALAAWIVNRLTGIPYSFTAHAHDLYVYEDGLARKVAGARFAVAISEFNRDLLLRAGAGPTPVEVVHCGVDPAAYAYRDRSPGAAPARLLCVAGLREYKGHRYLLAALAGGDGVSSSARLRLVGDGPLRGELEAAADALGVADRVDFLGALAEGEVARELDEASLFVLPSIVGRDGNTEGIPVALMEALAIGVPTVATRVSGVPELVRDGETGRLAEPGDAASLREAIDGLLADPEGAARMADAGRRLVESEFDVERSAGRLAELFRSGVSGARGAR
jgi:glycosyltransferase involved in cell wall biosynthesis